MMLIKRLLAFCLALAVATCFAGCMEDDGGYTHDGPLCENEASENVIVPSLAEASKMSGEELYDLLHGISSEDIQAKWGEPDGMLSGFRGDTWALEDDYTLILYYDAEGCVDTIKISPREQRVTTYTGPKE